MTQFSDRLAKSVDDFAGGNWAELARRAGLTRSTLQQIKNGADPRGDTLLRISRALDVSVDWLLSGEGQPPGAVSTPASTDLMTASIPVSGVTVPFRNKDKGRGQRLDAKAVLERLSQVLGVSDDAALAKALGLPRAHISQWKARGVVPYAACVQVAGPPGDRLPWLFWGALESEECAEEQAEYLAQRLPCDWELESLEKAVGLVIEGLAHKGREMSPRQQAELVIAVYDLLQDGVKDERLLRIVRSAV